MTAYLIPLLHGLVGAMLVMWMRNDTVERVSIGTFTLRMGRSFWCGLSMFFAGALIAQHFQPTVPGVLAALVTIGAFGFVLTAPHGQTLDGPQQLIPIDEDDLTLEIAGWITNHDLQPASRLGWPTWLVYNAIRYVLPMVFIGVMVGSPIAAAAGALTVFSYWPLAYMNVLKSRWDTRFFSAWMCGLWLYLGL